VSGLRGVTLTVRFLCQLAMLAATSLLNASQERQGSDRPPDP
jgi:hypothetical protein